MCIELSMRNKGNCCILSFLLHHLWIPQKIITDIIIQGLNACDLEIYLFHSIFITFDIDIYAYASAICISIEQQKLVFYIMYVSSNSRILMLSHVCYAFLFCFCQHNVNINKIDCLIAMKPISFHAIAIEQHTQHR